METNTNGNGDRNMGLLGYGGTLERKHGRLLQFSRPMGLVILEKWRSWPLKRDCKCLQKRYLGFIVGGGQYN